MIPDVKGYTEHFKDCVPYAAWNGYLCDNKDLGILLFESEDDDKWDRSMQPIYIKESGEGKVASNKLNSFMDHVWDGFYTGQVRLSRFPGLVQGGKG